MYLWNYTDDSATMYNYLNEVNNIQCSTKLNSGTILE